MRVEELAAMGAMGLAPHVLVPLCDVIHADALNDGEVVLRIPKIATARAAQSYLLAAMDERRRAEAEAEDAEAEDAR